MSVMIPNLLTYCHRWLSMKCFFYQMWLCTKITRLNKYLAIYLITSFNMTTVTPNTCLCPGLHSLKHMHMPIMTRCPPNASTSVMILPRRSLMSLQGVLNTLLLRYPQRKANHMGLSQGTLVATHGHDSMQLHVHCGFRVPSFCLWQLCGNEHVHQPAPNAWKLYATAVQNAPAYEGQLLHLSSGDTGHHWDCLRLVQRHCVSYLTCVQQSKTKFSTDVQALSEDRGNQPMVSYCKSGIKAFKQ